MVSYYPRSGVAQQSSAGGFLKRPVHLAPVLLETNSCGIVFEPFRVALELSVSRGAAMLMRFGLIAALLALILSAQGVVLSQGRGGSAAPAGRLVDNGDETVTDTQTGLMWEKKTTTFGSGTSEMDIRDVDNRYTWEYVMHDWIDRLNGRLIAFANDAAFGRHSDWRIPTMQELNTILEPQASGRIDAVFGPNAPASYWTSSRRLLTASTGSASVPWYINFGVAEIPVYLGQAFTFHVRAVRNAR